MTGAAVSQLLRPATLLLLLPCSGARWTRQEPRRTASEGVERQQGQMAPLISWALATSSGCDAFERPAVSGIDGVMSWNGAAARESQSCRGAAVLRTLEATLSDPRAISCAPATLTEILISTLGVLLESDHPVVDDRLADGAPPRRETAAEALDGLGSRDRRTTLDRLRSSHRLVDRPPGLLGVLLSVGLRRLAIDRREGQRH